MIGLPAGLNGRNRTMADDQEIHAHFSRIAEVYRRVRTTDDAPIRIIRDECDGLASITAADFGCGAGRYDLLLFSCLPNLRLTCVDANEDMLAELSRYLAAHGIRDFRTFASRVEDLELEDASLDCVFAFNAVHHFHFPTFLAKAGGAIRDGGRIFIYTRTPDQNARNIWGRYFPGFTEKETRLYALGDMETSVDAAAGLGIAGVKRFRYPRVAKLDRLLDQARSKHYSTFSLYAPEAFEAALKGFEDNVRREFADPDRVAWHDENIMLTVERTGEVG